MSESHADIVAVLNDYLGGFYNSGVESLRNVFHPNRRLYGAAQ